MTDPTPDSIRAQAAAEERAAILDIIERHARKLSHGHGVSGAQVLQQIVDEIERRARTERSREEAAE